MPHRIIITASLAAIFCLVLFFGLSSALPTATSTGLNDSQKNALTIEQAMVLGVVEGITEYLPVSSTGHLLIAERIMGVGETPSLSTERNAQIREATDAYTICIQVGAIVAVIGIFFRRIKQMLLGLIGKDNEGRQLLMNVVAGFIPAAVIGVFFNKMIKTYLFGPWPVIFAWFVGGLVILAVSNKKQGKESLMGQGKNLADLSWKMALVIGFAQCIAMWPGISRSLVTIVGGLLVGLSLSAAVEFSFLLGLITLSAATSFDFFTHGQVMLQTFDVLPLTIGIAVAFGSAILSVKWMVAYLTCHGLAIFGYYRVALSLIVGTLLFNGQL